MVGPTIVAVVGLALTYLSFGMYWIMGQGLDTSFLSLRSLYVSSSAPNSTYEGWALNSLMPYLAAPVQLLAIAFSVGVLFGNIAAIFRWRYM